MEIGIGIPNAIPGTTGLRLLEWARRAEAAGFPSLATIGAVSYAGYEELSVLAAAGAVTQQIRLVTNVLIAPARGTAELAKQVTSVDQLTGGRLVLGLGIGWRRGDFLVTGRAFRRRGRRFDEQLYQLRRALAGYPLTDGTGAVGPDPAQRPGVPMLIGGHADAAVRRAVEFGVGWTAALAPTEVVGQMAQRVQSAWREAGREGRARIMALAYFSLGDDVEDGARYLLDFYAPAGSEASEMIGRSELRSPEAISRAVQIFAEAGVDELILHPTVSDPDQVDALARVVL